MAVLVTRPSPDDETTAKALRARGFEVLRAPMKVESLPYSMEELTYVFTDVAGTSGTLRLMWDTVMASVTFTVAP